MFLSLFFKKNKNFLFLLFFLMFFCFPIFAQERMGIGISPFIIEESVRPGQVFIKEITITNRSNEKKVFEFLLQDIKLKENGQILLLEAGSEKFSIKDFVELPKEKIEILPHESKKIPIFFNISNQISGSRQGIIILKSEILNPEKNEAQGIFASFSHQLGVLVFLRSSEKIKDEARISKFFTDKNWYFFPFRVNFLTEIENSGNVYIVPLGIIKIENMFKREVARIMFNPQKLKILPETKRIFEQAWEGRFGFGKYTASLFINFGTPVEEGGEGTKNLFAKKEFWIFPKKEILFLVLTLGIFLLLIIIITRKIQKK